MKLKKQHIILMITFVLIFIIGLFRYKTGFIKDLFFTAFLALVLCLLYKKLKLTPVTYSLICLSFIVHNMGAFTFYAPLFGIPYDVITHILGLFSATLAVADFFSFGFTKSKKFHSDDAVLLLMIFLAGLGIGALVETMEYTGYLMWGQGEGFFQFGSGDYEGLNTTDKLTQIVGGGYFDTMTDLIHNMIGGMLAIILFGLNFFLLKREYV
jgi:hypothetical protein